MKKRSFSGRLILALICFGTLWTGLALAADTCPCGFSWQILNRLADRGVDLACHTGVPDPDAKPNYQRTAMIDPRPKPYYGTYFWDINWDADAKQGKCFDREEPGLDLKEENEYKACNDLIKKYAQMFDVQCTPWDYTQQRKNVVPRLDRGISSQ